MMSEWSAAQILEQFIQRWHLYEGIGYGLGVALRELARPERYRDELGHRSFEALLEARHLPSRMTAYKHILVVSHYTLDEVKELGGMDKCYYIIRAVNAEDPAADPRVALEPGRRVLGLDVRTSSGRNLRDALRGRNARPRPSGRPDTSAMKRAADRFRSAMKRAAIQARVRVHREDGQPCVAAHFDAGPALEVAKLVRAGLARAAPPP